MITHFLCGRIPQNVFLPLFTKYQGAQAWVWGYKSEQKSSQFLQQKLEQTWLHFFIHLQDRATLIGNKSPFVETPGAPSETFKFIVYPGFLIFRSTVSFATVVHQGDFPFSCQSLPKPSGASPVPRARRGSAPLHTAGRWLSILAHSWYFFFFKLDFTEIILSILPWDPWGSVGKKSACAVS